MARLINTNVMHSTEGQMDCVGFDTDEGAVDLTRFEDGTVDLEIAFEKVSVDEMAELVEDLERLDDDVLETIESILDDAREQVEDGEPVDCREEPTDDEETDEEDETDERGEVAHICDDGTKIRVGDRVNRRNAASDYPITGTGDKHTVRTEQPDEYRVLRSKLEKDVMEAGFSERVEVAE